MRFGLTAAQEALLTALFDKHLTQGKVIVYGSRATGEFAARSDLDLVLDAAGTTDRHFLAELKHDIMESDFPYLCDVFYLAEITNPALLEHIKNDGKILYEKRGRGGGQQPAPGEKLKKSSRIAAAVFDLS